MAELIMGPEPASKIQIAINTWMLQSVYKLEIDIEGDGNNVTTLRGRGICLPELSIYSMELSGAPFSINREKSFLADGIDSLCFGLPNNGRIECQTLGKTVTVDSRSGILVRSAEPYSCIHSSNIRGLVVPLPFSKLRERISWIEDCVACDDVFDRRLVPIARQFCHILLGVEVPSYAQARLQEDLLDILTLMIEQQNKDFDDLIPRSAKSINWVRLQRVIDMRFAEHSLNITTAANTLGLSESYIYKIAQAHDTSFHKMLMERRLFEARRRLVTSGDYIGQIAYSCGFKNQAHFATSFRHRFGVSPHEWRQYGGHGTNLDD